LPESIPERIRHYVLDGYTRAFLMHQADPERTLRKIAGMLRPGGWLVVQEPLRTPPPQSYPQVGTIGRYWELMHEAAAKSGVAPDAVENLRASAARAGFEIAAANGFFNVMEPSVGFDIHASAVAALKTRLVGTGVAAGSEVDELERSLHQAASGQEGWLTSPFMLDLTLRKPMISEAGR
jgi:SAM-dependent methyltransferase